MITQEIIISHLIFALVFVVSSVAICRVITDKLFVNSEGELSSPLRWVGRFLNPKVFALVLLGTLGSVLGYTVLAYSIASFNPILKIAASKSGLKPGDIVLQITIGDLLGNTQNLGTKFSELGSGQVKTATLTILRNDTAHLVRIEDKEMLLRVLESTEFQAKDVTLLERIALGIKQGVGALYFGLFFDKSKFSDGLNTSPSIVHDSLRSQLVLSSTTVLAMTPRILLMILALGLISIVLLPISATSSREGVAK